MPNNHESLRQTIGGNYVAGKKKNAAQTLREGVQALMSIHSAGVTPEESLGRGRCLVVKLLKSNEVDMSVETVDYRACDMTFANAFGVVGILAGVFAAVVIIGTIAFTLHGRFPMDVGRRTEGANLEGIWSSSFEVTESADGTVHDVAGHPLHAKFEVENIRIGRIHRAIVN